MRRRAAAFELEICPSCHKDFVNPVEWNAVDDERWWMLLRCGECGVSREVTVSNEVASRYDVELDRRADPIGRALHQLDLEGMAAYVETISIALQRELIDAADFAS